MMAKKMNKPLQVQVCNADEAQTHSAATGTEMAIAIAIAIAIAGVFVCYRNERGASLTFTELTLSPLVCGLSHAARKSWRVCSIISSDSGISRGVPNWV